MLRQSQKPTILVFDAEGQEFEYGDDLQREALVRWYHTYHRQEIKVGLMEIKTRNPVEFVTLERHFKQEIDELIGGIL